MSNLCLTRAKSKKDDEYYTLYKDIEKEIPLYKDYLENKVIYCNCDDYEVSQFVKYFKNNFKMLKLRGLISTGYNLSGSGKTLVYGENNAIYKELLGNGSYKSTESINLLRQSDIVITNPPFSLFGDFTEFLFGEGKDFIIIGNMNVITHKKVFPYFMQNRIYRGINSVLKFRTPDNNYKEVSGRWYTTFNLNKDKPFLPTVKKYSPEVYPKYDNYNAIEVGTLADIPKDYDGIMGVPISIFDKYNPKQFKILGVSEDNGLGLSYGIYDTTSKKRQPLINGKRMYKRIFIKRVVN